MNSSLPTSNFAYAIAKLVDVNYVPTRLEFETVIHLYALIFREKICDILNIRNNIRNKVIMNFGTVNTNQIVWKVLRSEAQDIIAEIRKVEEVTAFGLTPTVNMLSLGLSSQYYLDILQAEKDERESLLLQQYQASMLEIENAQQEALKNYEESQLEEKLENDIKSGYLDI